MNSLVPHSLHWHFRVPKPTSIFSNRRAVINCNLVGTHATKNGSLEKHRCFFAEGRGDSNVAILVGPGILTPCIVVDRAHLHS